MSVITDLEKVAKQLSRKRNAKMIVEEYKNAIAVLKNEKMITSEKFTNVINDMNAVIQFENGFADKNTEKIEEYTNAIAKLTNASI